MKYRGVNLGGWLVVERWITPSVFAGSDAKDEFTLCGELGGRASERLEAHRRNFITEADIIWMKEHGLNAVRLPVPYWVFEDVLPFVRCDRYVDWLLEAAQKHGIAVLLCLHTAPGSQNGNDHSGRAGEVGWHKSSENISRTLAVLEAIAKSWGNHSSVMGLELLNEPSPHIDYQLLVNFYRQAIRQLKKLLPEKSLVVSDAFRPEDWGRASFAGHPNVVLDMHLYQAFNKPMRPDKHIQKAKTEWRELIGRVQQALPAIVGEWSLGLDPKVFRGLDDFARDKMLQAFAAAQIETFEQSQGWFFWTYKIEGDWDGWSFRACVKRGWLPTSLLQ